MQESSQDFLTRAAGYVLGFLGVSGLLGWAQYKLAARRAPTDIRLASAQADVQQATAEEIRARSRREDENAIVTNLRVVTQELRADVQRLREERDKAEAQVKILELELEQAGARRKLGGNGKGN